MGAPVMDLMDRAAPPRPSPSIRVRIDPVIEIASLKIFAIFAAFFIQYVLKHQPCNLCLIERIPYIASIIIILICNKVAK